VIGSPREQYCFQRADKNTGAHFFTATERGIPGVRLDELIEMQFIPRVVKIDIEGLEAVALRDAQNLLLARPILYIEVAEHLLRRNSSSIEELDALLRRFGYRFFRNVGDRNGAHDDFVANELDRLSEGGGFFDVLAIHRYDIRLNVSKLRPLAGC
jgi:hypothetical protein